MPPPQQSGGPAKPGVIPLRPLGLSEILDGAISTMRAHPLPMLGVSAIIVTITQLMVLASTYSMLDDLNRAVAVDENTPPDEVFASLGTTLTVLGITLVITLLASVLLAGFLTIVVGKAVLGHPIGFTEVWSRVRPRLLPLLGLTLIYPAVALAAGVIVFLIGALAPPLGVLLAIGLIPVGIWLYVMFSLATPVLMLENAGIAQAFGRSRWLVRGSWWRIFGIELLARVLVIIVALIVTLPFEYLGGGFDNITSTEPTPPTVTYLTLSTVGAIIAGTITEPFVAAVTVLLYTDQRMRREGMDIELARMAQQPPP
jgi:hypothetical protein